MSLVYEYGFFCDTKSKRVTTVHFFSIMNMLHTGWIFMKITDQFNWILEKSYTCIINLSHKLHIKSRLLFLAIFLLIIFCFFVSWWWNASACRIVCSQILWNTNLPIHMNDHVVAKNISLVFRYIITMKKCVWDREQEFVLVYFFGRGRHLVVQTERG